MRHPINWTAVVHNYDSESIAPDRRIYSTTKRIDKNLQNFSINSGTLLESTESFPPVAHVGDECIKFVPALRRSQRCVPEGSLRIRAPTERKTASLLEETGIQTVPPQLPRNDVELDQPLRMIIQQWIRDQRHFFYALAQQMPVFTIEIRRGNRSFGQLFLFSTIPANCSDNSPTPSKLFIRRCIIQSLLDSRGTGFQFSKKRLNNPSYMHRDCPPPPERRSVQRPRPHRGLRLCWFRRHSNLACQQHP